MITANIRIRLAGGATQPWTGRFPAVPRVGDYINISQARSDEHKSAAFAVKKVSWTLEDGAQGDVLGVDSIHLECEAVD